MRPSDYHPTERFTGLADLYSQYRPDYPRAALDFVISRCGLDDRSVLVDVGCGTGISSRLFAARGIQVIGIEPNADMRRQAESELVSAGATPPTYREGRAEGTGLPEASADAVVAAQAFHWFEPEATLREFHRVLKPSGWAILLWNQRNESDPFTQAYGGGVRQLSDAEAVEPYHGIGDALLESPLFQQGQRTFFTNEQILDEAGLLGRAFSVSYAPRDPNSSKRYAQELRELFQRFQKEGRVTMRYETSVFLARRRSRKSQEPATKFQ
jgi:SAM-dependent methyltransferase